MFLVVELQGCSSFKSSKRCEALMAILDIDGGYGQWSVSLTWRYQWLRTVFPRWVFTITNFQYWLITV